MTNNLATEVSQEFLSNCIKLFKAFKPAKHGIYNESHLILPELDFSNAEI